MDEVSKFYSIDQAKRQCYREREERRENNEETMKKYLHPKHSQALFKSLGANYYVFYKILSMLWNEENIDPQDLQFITKCKLLGIRSIVKRKFNVELIFGPPDVIA